MPKGVYIRTEETRKKTSEAAKGRKHNKETKEKISRANKGRKFSKEHRRKLGIAQKKRTGKKNGNWQGGISYEKAPPELTLELKQDIRRRDNFTCQSCDKKQKDNHQKLDVHHIDGDRKNNHPDNLITLCRSCHKIIELTLLRGLVK